MRWNFAQRSGFWKVWNFDDNKRFGGRMAMPGPHTGNANQFVGRVSGNDNLRGYAVGSFVKRPGDGVGTVPVGAIGNFAVRNGNYNAGGIFAGSQTIPGSVSD